jgi:hypothetical protein
MAERSVSPAIRRRSRRDVLGRFAPSTVSAWSVILPTNYSIVEIFGVAAC